VPVALLQRSARGCSVCILALSQRVVLVLRVAAAGEPGEGLFELVERDLAVAVRVQR